MSKTPSYDEKVHEILNNLETGEGMCRLTGETWKMDEEEMGWYKKFNVPPSSWSPLTRMIVLASFGNAYQWWYQKHPETGAQVLTYVHPASGIKVLPDKEWFDRDFSDRNLPVDLHRSFFEMMYELERSIPFMASRNMREPENSLSVVSLGDKNDILTMASKAQNCLFGIVATNAESSAELFFSYDVTNSYMVSQSDRIFNCRFVNASYDCMDSSFLFDCRNCTDCFGVVNRRNGKYLFWDQQLSESEYRHHMEKVDLSCRSRLETYQRRYVDLMASAVWPENFNVKADGCVGEYLNNCLDCRFAFNCSHGPKHCYWLNFSLEQTENCAFVDGGVNATDCYQCLAASDSSHCRFCFSVSKCRNMEYCMQCFNCEDCFGCVGLNRKRFHIFNRPYKEEDYWQRVDELKCIMLDRGEYGEFFPPHHSSAYFPESTVAAMGFGTEELGRKLCANVFEIDTDGAVGNLDAPNTARLEDIPNCLSELGDEWIRRPIYDPEIRRRFAFFPQEVEFYRKHRLAPPAQHFITRMKGLIALRNVPIYEVTVCAKCSAEVTVAKNKTFPERKIYCRGCYLKYLERGSEISAHSSACPSLAGIGE